MAKTYYLRFGDSNPSDNTGLTPTFTVFSWNGQTALTSPGITETPSGSGLYSFSYGPTISILFKVDGGAALADADRYIAGALDPLQVVDERLGTVSDSFGSTYTDPSTVFAYLKRSQEFWEGNSTYTKSSGIWNIYSRGSSTLLAQKTLVNNSTSATKT